MTEKKNSSEILGYLGKFAQVIEDRLEDVIYQKELNSLSWMADLHRQCQQQKI